MSDTSSTQATQATRSALVTGASTGIGEATVRQLRDNGWRVYATARRADRLNKLAAETGAIAVPGDITEDADVERILATVTGSGSTGPASTDAGSTEAGLTENGTTSTEPGGIDTLINIAGGARGQDWIADAKTEDWEWMYRVNVLGTMKLIRAFLPMLRAHGNATVLNLTSTAALAGYEGGAGYNAAKWGERALTRALRVEEVEHNIRVIEVLPGMVHTPEFSLMRFGSQEKADKIYQGVENPLTGADVADVINYAISLPHHVNLDEIVIRPLAQAAQHKVIRR